MTEILDRRLALERLLEDRVAILDGGMGTRIQSLGLREVHYRGAELRNHDSPLRGNYEILSMTQPSLIATIHMDYFDAGADIISTNTFRANLPSMAGYGLAAETYALNLAAARLAIKVRNHYEELYPNWPRFVAGAVSIPDPTAGAYEEQLHGLLVGGVDLLLFETVFDTRNALAALNALDRCIQTTGRPVPVVVSATINESGQLPSGETVEDFWRAVAQRELFGVGINCSVGPRLIESYLGQLSELATCFLACYPNAGLPETVGHYPDSPGTIASVLREFAFLRWLNIAGGCCGTGPEHVRRIRASVESLSPRALPQP